MPIPRLGRIAGPAACAILLAVSLAGCSAPGGSESAQDSNPLGSYATATVLGPFSENASVVSDGVRLELISVTIKAEDANRIGRKFFVNPPVTMEPAAPGHRYVDVTLGLRTVSDASAFEGVWPVGWPEPFVIADDERYTVADWPPRMHIPADKTVEFELPEDVKDCVIYVPMSEDATEVVSFRVW